MSRKIFLFPMILGFTMLCGCTSQDTLSEPDAVISNTKNTSANKNQGGIITVNTNTQTKSGVSDNHHNVNPLPQKNKRKPVIPKTKKYKYRWATVMTSFMEELNKNHSLGAGTVLVVGPINNQTNGDIVQEQNRMEITKALSSHNKYRVVHKDIIVNTRKKMGLKDIDTLTTMNKATAVARNCGADYIVLPVLKGNVKKPKLTLRLVKVSNKEIYLTMHYKLQAIKK